MGAITVKGRGGYVSAQPDVVTLSFDIGTKARDYAECVDRRHRAYGGSTPELSGCRR